MESEESKNKRLTQQGVEVVFTLISVLINKSAKLAEETGHVEFLQIGALLGVLTECARKGKMEELTRLVSNFYREMESTPETEVDEIDIDTILDRINEVGFDNLSQEEIEFLNQQKNNH